MAEGLSSVVGTRLSSDQVIRPKINLSRLEASYLVIEYGDAGHSL